MSSESKSVRSGGDGKDEIDLMRVAMRVWGGRWIILTCMLLGGVLAGFLALRASPVYQANALIQLESRGGGMALPESMQMLLGSEGGSGQADTEKEILQSRMVLGNAVRALDLQTRAAPVLPPILGELPRRLGLPDPGFAPDLAWGGERIAVAELEVPEDWLGEEMRVVKESDDSYSVTLPDGSVHQGQLRQRLGLPQSGFSLVVERLDGPVGRAFELTRVSLGSAIEDMQKRFDVKVAARGTQVLSLGYMDGSRGQAEQALNAIMAAYVSQNISRSSVEAENSLKFIEEQLPLARAEVDATQQALNVYRQEQNSVDVSYETKSLLERVTALEQELNALALREEELRTRYTVNHPTYQLLLENRASLEKQLADLRNQSSALPETQKEIFNLTRDLEVAQQVYLQLLNRAQELRVVRASTAGSVRVIDDAYSSRIMVSPKLGRNLAIGLFVGLVLGIGFVLMRHFLHNGVRGSEDIENLGLTVLGTIPFTADAADHRRRRGTLPIHAITNPDDLLVEGLRSLRTSLHFGMLDASTRSLAVTSSAPAAGKSFLAVNLATVAAQAGQKVCLVDADMRRGYLRRYVDMQRDTKGLSDYLSGQATLEQVVLQGPTENLSVILSGRYPPNPSELLMREEFPRMLKILDEQYDLVVIDCPPVLAVTDPVIIGRYAGTTVVVVRHMETAVGEVEAVLDAFETAHVKIGGAILNGYVQGKGEDRYGKYGYYNYRYSYKTAKDH